MNPRKPRPKRLPPPQHEFKDGELDFLQGLLKEAYEFVNGENVAVRLRARAALWERMAPEGVWRIGSMGARLNRMKGKGPR